MLHFIRRRMPVALAAMGDSLRDLISAGRSEPTTFQRCLAVHMHFAEHTGALH